MGEGCLRDTDNATHEAEGGGDTVVTLRLARVRFGPFAGQAFRCSPLVRIQLFHDLVAVPDRVLSSLAR